MKKNAQPKVNSNPSAALRRSALVLAAVAAGAFLAATSSAHAAIYDYVANTTPLNNSGVYGTFNLVYDSTANTLTVAEHATGLEPNEPHLQHIHGMLAPNQASTMVATSADDTNGDGFIDLAEGEKNYGPILLDLSSPPGGALSAFPTAPGGVINFKQTYNLADSSDFGTSFTAADLFPLTDREIVIHGMTVPSSFRNGSTKDGTSYYDVVLPVSDGMIHVPEPGSLALLMTGVLGCLLAVRRSRRG